MKEWLLRKFDVVKTPTIGREVMGFEGVKVSSPGRRISRRLVGLLTPCQRVLLWWAWTWVNKEAFSGYCNQRRWPVMARRGGDGPSMGKSSVRQFSTR